MHKTFTSIFLFPCVLATSLCAMENILIDNQEQNLPQKSYLEQVIEQANTLIDSYTKPRKNMLSKKEVISIIKVAGKLEALLESNAIENEELKNSIGAQLKNIDEFVNIYLSDTLIIKRLY